MKQRKKSINKRTQALPKAKTSIPNHFSNGMKQIVYGLNDLFTPITIYDYRIRKMVYVNDKFIKLTGLTKAECYNLDLDEFDRWIDPDDLIILQTGVAQHLADICDKVVKKNSEKMKYLVNFRLKGRNRSMIHVLSQSSIVEWDKNKMPAVIINLLTDITHHKKDHKITLIVNHFNEEEDQWKTLLTAEFLHQAEMLTIREKEIMAYILKDKSAREISDETRINFNTVRTHWNNILQKTQSKSQKELKEKARKDGWM